MIILTCIGITMILQYGSILKRPRGLLMKVGFLSSLIKCSLCMGFWVGAGLAVAKFKLDANLFEALCLPFASASACWLFDSFMSFTETSVVRAKSESKEVAKSMKNWY